PARDFTLADLDGKRWALADYRGQPVLLTFFASWCQKCDEEIAAVNHLTQGKPMAAAVVCRDPQNEEEIRQRVNEAGFTAPILADPKIQVFSQFDVQNLPTTILLDRTGVEIFRATGGGAEDRDQLALHLDKMLAPKKKKISIHDED
ncbi:MAG: TlpA family protein disulfide reductase, partial [Alphaproteobacteria bacterium]